MIPAVSSAERPGPVFVFSPPPTPPRGRVPRAALPTRPGGPRGAPLLRCARSLAPLPPAPPAQAPGWRRRRRRRRRRPRRRRLSCSRLCRLGTRLSRLIPPKPLPGNEGGGGGSAPQGLGARQQPGRREAESERGPGRVLCLPFPAAARAEAAARQRASGRAAGLSGKSAPLSSESPSLRHEAQHCHFTQRRRGCLANPERSAERAQTVERTRSLPLTKKEGRERAAAAAAGPQPLSLGSAAAEGFGENPARSSRLCGACAAFLLAFLSVSSRPHRGEREA
nr:serine/arginine repetitive matrix protein 3-like [Manis javanica]